jgi:phosphotransferase system  glucose/maltose/N-acetylglucosamine-specific IIC component
MIGEKCEYCAGTASMILFLYCRAWQERRQNTKFLMPFIASVMNFLLLFMLCSFLCRIRNLARDEAMKHYIVDRHAQKRATAS